jgi:hypothetical protein
VSAGPEEIIREEVRAMKAYPSPGRWLGEARHGKSYGLRRRCVRSPMPCRVSPSIDPTPRRWVRRLRETMGIPAEFDVLLGNGSDESSIIVQSVARRARWFSPRARAS